MRWKIEKRNRYGQLVDDDGELHDGDALHVPLMLCDAARHKPGFRSLPAERISVIDTKLRALRDASFGAMVDQLTGAWRRPVNDVGARLRLRPRT